MAAEVVAAAVETVKVATATMAPTLDAILLSMNSEIPSESPGSGHYMICWDMWWPSVRISMGPASSSNALRCAMRMRSS